MKKRGANRSLRGESLHLVGRIVTGLFSLHYNRETLAELLEHGCLCFSSFLFTKYKYRSQENDHNVIKLDRKSFSLVRF